LLKEYDYEYSMMGASFNKNENSIFGNTQNLKTGE